MECSSRVLFASASVDSILAIRSSSYSCRSSVYGWGWPGWLVGWLGWLGWYGWLGWLGLACGTVDGIAACGWLDSAGRGG